MVEVLADAPPQAFRPMSLEPWAGHLRALLRCKPGNRVGRIENAHVKMHVRNSPLNAVTTEAMLHLKVDLRAHRSMSN